MPKIRYRMKNRPRPFLSGFRPQSEKGMAVLLAVTITTVLITATLELNRKMRTTVVAAATTRDRAMLAQVCQSGVHMAMALLVKDKKDGDTDSIQEDWANPEKIAELLAEFPLKQGSLKLEITDELGKIQVNSLVDFPRGRQFNPAQKVLWDRFAFHLLSQNEDMSETEATTIVNSLKDWLDSGDDDAITGLNGAESDYYQTLDPPYEARNGPLRSPEELYKIRGITPGLFTGEPVEDEQMLTDLEKATRIRKLSDYITVYGAIESKKKHENKKFTYEGKININTAKLPVVAALLPTDSVELAPAICEYREEKSDGEYIHDLKSPGWYKNAPGCGDLKIAANLVTYASDFFRIRATATLHDVTMTTETVVHREKNKESGKWRCRVLSWQESES